MSIDEDTSAGTTHVRAKVTEGEQQVDVEGTGVGVVDKLRRSDREHSQRAGVELVPRRPLSRELRALLHQRHARAAKLRHRLVEGDRGARSLAGARVVALAETECSFERGPVGLIAGM